MSFNALKPDTDKTRLTLEQSPKSQSVNEAKEGNVETKKKTISFAILIAILSCLFASQSYSQENNKEYDAVIRNAEKFLLLIDENKYQETWEWLSSNVKKTMTEEQWIADLKGFRKPLGDLLQRKLLHVTESYDEDIGNYLIIQYESSFETKKTKGEAVSVIRDSKNGFKILGYSIF